MDVIDAKYLMKNITEANDLIGKLVIIKADTSKEFKGQVKAIDPESGSMVLLTIAKDLPSQPIYMQIIAGHVIHSVEVQSPEADYSKLEETNKSILDKISLKTRYERIVEFFEKNHVPIVEKENGELEIAFLCTLKYPYNAENCVCSNESFLTKIQNLIAQIP